MLFANISGKKLLRFHTNAFELLYVYDPKKIKFMSVILSQMELLIQEKKRSWIAIIFLPCVYIFVLLSDQL